MSQKTTFVIYRIWNTVNGKCYVGLTTNFKERVRQHFSHLKNKTHKNPVLQNAYDKHGKVAFKAEILEGVIALEELGKREIYWIAHYDSYNNGYNLTIGGYSPSGTDAIKKQCVWEGVEYSSIKEATLKLGISRDKLTNYLLKGYKGNADIPQTRKRKGIETIWNGITYPSIVIAAKALGISPQAMAGRITRGHSSDDDMPRILKPQKR